MHLAVHSPGNCHESFSLFVSLFPCTQVDEATYRSTIEHVNEQFDDAEGLGCCNVLEGCLSCMTGFALHYCFKTHYERVRVGVKEVVCV